jgi:hypothetical protein
MFHLIMETIIRVLGWDMVALVISIAIHGMVLLRIPLIIGLSILLVVATILTGTILVCIIGITTIFQANRVALPVILMFIETMSVTFMVLIGLINVAVMR